MDKIDIRSKKMAVSHFVNCFFYNRLAIPFFKQSIDLYLHQLDSSGVNGESRMEMMFRDDPFWSCALEYFMNITSLEYIQKILRPIVKEIVTNHPTCQLNSLLLEPGESIKKNMVIQIHFPFFLTQI